MPKLVGYTDWHPHAKTTPMYTCLNCGKEFPTPRGKDTRVVGGWIAVAIWMTFLCTKECRDEWAKKQKAFRGAMTQP